MQMMGKIFNNALVQSIDRQAFPTDPIDEVFCCSDVPASGYSGVARLTQLFSEIFKQVARRTVAKLGSAAGYSPPFIPRSVSTEISADPFTALFPSGH